MSLDSTACLWYYGDPSTKAFEQKWMVLYSFPKWMADIFPPYQKITKVTKQWLNKDLVGPLEAAFKELLRTGLYKELKSYDGAWNVRKKRGLSDYSIHSWGLALDFNALDNPLGGKVRFSQAFLQVFRDQGFTCGADFGNGRTDGMHLEVSKLAIKAYQAHLAAPKPTPKK